MIITCKACSTNYNLDESLLKPEGIKVRCSVCRTVFKAFPPEDDLLATGIDLPDFDAGETSPDSFREAGPLSEAEPPAPAVFPEDGQGEIIELELDEKSLGIDDIIDSLIFIPKDPDALEPQRQPAKDSGEKGAAPGADDAEPAGEEDDSEELFDLDMPDDDDFDLETDLVPQASALPEEDAGPADEDIDTEFTPPDIDVSVPDIEGEEHTAGKKDPGETGDDSLPVSDDLPELESLETLNESDASDEFALEDSSDIDIPDLESDDIEPVESVDVPPELEPDADDGIPFDGFPAEDIPEQAGMDDDLDLDLHDTADVPVDDDDFDDAAFDLEDVDSAPDSDGFEFDFDEDTSDSGALGEEEETVFDGDAPAPETDDGIGELELELSGTDDETDDSPATEEENGDIEFLDFDDDSQFESDDQSDDESADDGFAFDTGNELILEEAEYDDEDSLEFEAVDDDFDISTMNLENDDAPYSLAEADDSLELELTEDEDVTDFAALPGDDSGLSLDDEPETDETDDGELFLDDELTLDDEEEDDGLLELDSDFDSSDSDLPEEPETLTENGDQADQKSLDDIEGAFELEFDMDPDLGLADEKDPDYLQPASLEMEDGEDGDVMELEEEDDDESLDMLEVETDEDDDDDGEAFLEDLSESDDFSEYDEVMEQEEEPEIILEDGETAPGLTRAAIHKPAVTPPPLTSRHFAREKSGKVKQTGGFFSFIFKFLFLLIIIAAVFLAVYSYSVVTGDKIPYVSDLQIPIIDQYLKKPAPKPEPVLVYPTDPSVSARFIANEKTGNLFVISGKVVNDSSIFISHIQVQGTLVTKDKVRAKSKTAFCGNILTDEQLEKEDMAKIDEILARKTGDNNTNVKIRPQGMVQFMIVFSDLPDLLQNFEVKVAGFDRTGPEK